MGDQTLVELMYSVISRHNYVLIKVEILKII